MALSDQNVTVYRELADWYDRQGQPQLRDRFLVLAADAAQSGGQAAEAERLRQRLLQLSPHHMLRPFATFAEAMRSPDVQSYLNDLRRGYAPATAQGLLNSLRSGTSSGPSAGPPPPSVPDLDIELPLHETIDTTEALRVYRMAEEQEPAPPPARSPAPVPRPAAMPAGRSSPASAPRATPPPRPPVVPRPEPPRPAAPVLPPPELEEERARRGNWVAVALGMAVVGAGVTLLFYTLIRPFLR